MSENNPLYILIADNELFFAENVARYLSNELEARVDNVQSAAEARDCMSRGKYDLLISDLDLPDAPGGRWLPEMARRYPGQKLIITSAREIPPLLAGELKMAPGCYLEKPFDLTELKERIIKLTGPGQ